MPRRELLTPTQRVQLFAFPEDEGELIRLATLARADLTYIRQHRGDHNRLGLAIQMVYLRHPSRVLPPSEAPYPPLLGIVAAQLKVTPAAWSQYAKRDETRREHLLELPEPTCQPPRVANWWKPWTRLGWWMAGPLERLCARACAHQ
jgi:TnpA family transposase